jgi:hypothetical protein
VHFSTKLDVKNAVATPPSTYLYHTDQTWLPEMEKNGKEKQKSTLTETIKVRGCLIVHCGTKLHAKDTVATPP